MKAVSIVVRAVLPIALLVASVLGARALIRSRPQPAKKARADQGLLVETLTVERGRQRVSVHAKGNVIPAREVTLQPEVTGRVLWQHPELIVGGRIKKGATLLRIDPRDYDLSVHQQTAQVERATLELELEQARQKVAEREWQLFGEAPPTPRAGALALRKPQLRTAQVALHSAKSGLDKAKLQLKRTLVKAPFNALVRSEAVEVGQLVSPQSRLATLVGSDAFFVQVAVPVDELGSVRIPGLNAERGSAARVLQQIGEQRIERRGRVMRLLGEVDPMGRMARLLVQVDDPLGLEVAGEDRARGTGMPLLLGAYVSVELQGGEVAGVAEIPRLTLRAGNGVYVARPDNTLGMRQVRIVHRRAESVLVRGLDSGERLIVSPVPSAIEGMRLRTLADKPSKRAPGKRAPGKRSPAQSTKAPAEKHHG
ncbi:MAG: efflux RND transporter periplasmic adaptor subunit [Proteobacteria bacterium]|nr:efflux RND transporter periplasmic adaptor subunit [Pseudomonadota bacterium]